MFRKANYIIIIIKQITLLLLLKSIRFYAVIQKNTVTFFLRQRVDPQMKFPKYLAVASYIWMLHGMQMSNFMQQKVPLFRPDRKS